MKSFKHITLGVAAALVSLLEPLYVMVTNYLSRTGMLATLILDRNLLFDGTVTTATGALNGVNITTTSVGTQTSSNIIDLVNARDMGMATDGNPPRLLVLVQTAFVSTGAGTLTILFQGSTDSTNWTTYAQSPAIASGTLVAGATLLNIDLPGILPQTGALPRYLRLAYAVGTQVFTVGALISAITLSRDANRAYPPGVTISN